MTMKIFTLIFTSIALFFTTNSCEYITSINKTGDIDSLVFVSNSPAGIEINAPCNILLTNDNTNNIILKGYDFIIDGYQLKSSDQKLVVDHKSSGLIQKEKMGTLVIGIKSLSSITLNSPAVIFSNDTVHTQSLTMVVNGSGIYSETNLIINCQSINLNVYGGVNQTTHHISGLAANASYYIEGCTSVDASELISQNTNIVQRSISDCKVNVNQNLAVTIYSKGDVYYRGEPQLSFEKHKTTLMNATGEIFNLHK
jgi:hypothetical protein